MIELALKLRAIHSSFMVYRWTMACSYHSNTAKTPRITSLRRRASKAIAVEDAIWPKAQTGYQGLAGSALQDGRVPPEH